MACQHHTFVAENEATQSIWLTGLRALISSVSTTRLDSARLWIKTQYFALQDSVRSNIRVKSLSEILQRTGAARARVHELITKAFGHGVPRFESISMAMCPLSKFESMLLELEERVDLAGIFNSADVNPLRSSELSLSQFIDFLVNIQGLSKGQAEQRASLMIGACEPTYENAVAFKLSTQGFMNFLHSDDSALINPRHHDMHMDMTEPLCHYYIDSSHNTYLTGHQLKGSHMHAWS
jgi:phosphatidylinositol phospholipase C, beta